MNVSRYLLFIIFLCYFLLVIFENNKKKEEAWRRVLRPFPIDSNLAAMAASARSLRRPDQYWSGSTSASGFSSSAK